MLEPLDNAGAAHAAGVCFGSLSDAKLRTHSKLVLDADICHHFAVRLPFVSDAANSADELLLNSTYNRSMPCMCTEERSYHLTKRARKISLSTILSPRQIKSVEPKRCT